MHGDHVATNVFLLSLWLQVKTVHLSVRLLPSDAFVVAASIQICCISDHICSLPNYRYHALVPGVLLQTML